MNPWISAMRLRTLPLSIAGIITGGAMAYNDSKINFNSRLFVLAILTALLLQILSNFANDYGDFKNGADNESRKGPQRAVQSGAISAETMRIAIILFGILSLVSGLCLLYMAFAHINLLFIVYLCIGIGCIAAALKYTMGNNPYGYKGWGDFFVFLFFGLVSSSGIYFLLTLRLPMNVLLPSISIGAWSTAVLNLNNLRDIENDKASGKITIPVRLGKAKGLMYQSVLMVIPFIVNASYALIKSNYTLLAFTCFTLLPAYILFRPLLKNQDHETLDTSLKKTALFALLFTLSFVVGLCFN